MNRVLLEKKYWNSAALDSEVDQKYISDVNDGFDEMLGELDGKVLEIGCGVGRLLKDGWYGIDISENMLATAMVRKPKCHYKICDGRNIPYANETFDSVYCVLVFQHLPIDAVEDYIYEASQVLKKGGKFIFQFIEGTEDEPFSHHHSLDKVKKFLKNEGFTIEYIKKGVIHPLWTWIKATYD